MGLPEQGVPPAGQDQGPSTKSWGSSPKDAATPQEPSLHCSMMERPHFGVSSLAPQPGVVEVADVDARPSIPAGNAEFVVRTIAPFGNPE